MQQAHVVVKTATSITLLQGNTQLRVSGDEAALASYSEFTAQHNYDNWMWEYEHGEGHALLVREVCKDGSTWVRETGV